MPTTIVKQGKKRSPVQLDAVTHAQVKNYSEMTGVPINRVIQYAIKDWMETVGVARMEALAACAHSDAPIAPVVDINSRLNYFATSAE